MEHIFKTVDLTLLKPTTNLSDIEKLCDIAYNIGASSICIPPSLVKYANKYSKVPICTIIGYDYGYATSTVKLVEAVEAIKNGASELDIMINASDVKCGYFDKIEDELKKIRSYVGITTLKAVINTEYFITDEKKILCEIINKCNIDFIHIISNKKNISLIEDIHTIKKNLDKGIGIKVSGNIDTIEDIENCIEEGAIRIGISNFNQIINQ